ncbi:hypothetical protein LCGC14_1620390 [marine sediment metagenome]|uniref:Uncharacterized protein n=1 Tax=marine sediment metagenome TaxID=412755 RepID=A0A0F9I5U1_9ZZZZ|nr:hypothetical protein [bacterium]
MRYHKFKFIFKGKRARDNALRFVNKELNPHTYLQKMDTQWVGDEFESKRISREIGFWKKCKEPVDIMDEIRKHSKKNLILGFSEPIKRPRNVKKRKRITKPINQGNRTPKG